MQHKVKALLELKLGIPISIDWNYTKYMYKLSVYYLNRNIQS